MSRPTGSTTRALRAMHERQIRRDPWPDFEGFDREAYPLAVRRRAANQWWRRAREEYGSIHEFTLVTHALCEARAPIELTGALARLITDEVRHAELCSAMARALDPDGAWDWAPPRAPFPTPPEDADAILAWAADALLCSCCIGETLSRPLFESLATVITDPVPESVVRQVLRDEHLHARFGWEALGWLVPQLDDEERAWLQRRLARRLAGFERSCACGHSLESLVGVELVVESPPPGAPANLGHLEPEIYATIFYATLEAEVLPGFAALGLDPQRAWHERAQAAREGW